MNLAHEHLTMIARATNELRLSIIVNERFNGQWAGLKIENFFRYVTLLPFLKERL